MERTWSKVSMEGERPPCRQNIWKHVWLDLDTRGRYWDSGTYGLGLLHVGGARTPFQKSDFTTTVEKHVLGYR